MTTFRAPASAGDSRQTSTPGVPVSGGEPHPADFLENTPELRSRHHAHGSIRVQEGQPRKLLIYFNILLTHTRAGFEPESGWDREEGGYLTSWAQ